MAAFSIEHRETTDKHDQDGGAHHVDSHPAAQPAGHAPVEHAQDRDETQQPKRTQQRQSDDRKIDQVRPEEPPPIFGQDQPGGVVDDEDGPRPELDRVAHRLPDGRQALVEDGPRERDQEREGHPGQWPLRSPFPRLDGHDALVGRLMLVGIAIVRRLWATVTKARLPICIRAGHRRVLAGG